MQRKASTAVETSKIASARVVTANELAAVGLAAEVELPDGSVAVLRAAEGDADGLVVPLMERRLVVGGVGGVT